MFGYGYYVQLPGNGRKVHYTRGRDSATTACGRSLEGSVRASVPTVNHIADHRETCQACMPGSAVSSADTIAVSLGEVQE